MIATTAAAIEAAAIYRREAFVEDLEFLPQPMPVQAADTATTAECVPLWHQLAAGWLVAVPGTAAVLVGATLKSLPCRSERRGTAPFVKPAC